MGSNTGEHPLKTSATSNKNKTRKASKIDNDIRKNNPKTPPKPFPNHPQIGPNGPWEPSGKILVTETMPREPQNSPGAPPKSPQKSPKRLEERT